MKILRSAVAGLVLLLGAGVTMCAAQKSQQELYDQSPQPVQTNPGMPSVDGTKPGDGNSVSPLILARQERIRNADRQKQLMLDTDKLLALATELKADVDKTNKDVLSVDVVKKAEEIEKLAKSVKDRMKS
jgi:proline dehydrogenase